MAAVRVTEDDTPPDATAPYLTQRRPRKLVVFADGTGNAFTTQQSNVWRLFEALDQTGPDQVARYIPGVGTSGFKPFAILDGATGLGVPSNVRKLYRFICWNWRPGDEIWMFGFSRGAFTVRTLAALIASQGLVPIRFPEDGPVSRDEMGRNAMAAWRAYRAEAAPAGWMRPTIAITRTVRDWLLAAWHASYRHRRYAEVRAEMARSAANDEAGGEDAREDRIRVPIAFLGVFDTVEAFGVPIEEMRRAIDWVFWPIRFRNRVLSRNVDQARHALSLDDERTSFHPIQFDMRDHRGRIREVWFAGVHSDVGGGYPDASLSHVPLVWMLDEIAVLPSRLRFHGRSVATFRNEASAFGPIHDSRAGLSVLYRYDPRTVRVDGAGGGSSDDAAAWERPEVHHSVVARMTMGDDLYAPVSLPGNARMRLPSPAGAVGTPVALDHPGLLSALAAQGGTPRPPRPTAGYFALVQARIWWRRAAYLALLLGFLILLLLPILAGPINSGINRTVAWIFRAIGRPDWGLNAAERLFGLDGALANNIRLVAPALSGVLPGFARIYVDTLLKFPLACALAIGVGAIVLRQNDWLRDKIADDARCAWFGGAPSQRMSALNRIGSALRRVERVRVLHRVWTRAILPAAFAILLLLLVGVGIPVAVSGMIVAGRSARGDLCAAPDARGEARSRGGAPAGGVPLVEDEARVVPERFKPDRPCWSTGVRLEQGNRYRVILSERVPFFDKATVSGIAGFPARTWTHTLTTPLLRRLDAGWFQPIARIGIHRQVDGPLNLAGGLEFPLNDIDGSDMRGDVQTWNGRPLPVRIVQRNWPHDLTHVSERIPPGSMGAAIEFHQSLQRLPRGMVTEFVADADGELFIFVNDATFALPFLPTVWAFYRNNSGEAEVTVRKLSRSSK